MLRVRILATVTAVLLKINIHSVRIRFSKTEDALGMVQGVCLKQVSSL